ncbi:hypothetical protein [Spirosoma aerolatum]|uniref:hypothetical protein n=1 Tax=Spirosoma aerolatum TaxID=1211326 RepID=UPI0009AE94CE|nr:hypothetical protein [Spirosoma aerolatum]
MILTLTKKSATTGDIQVAHKEFDLTSEEVRKVMGQVRETNAGDFSPFATIYIDPDQYILEADGESVEFKPQLWPVSQSEIIHELMQNLRT